jgi:hypothetical protein
LKILIYALLLVGSLAVAEEKRRPPKEAMAACEGKTAGTECSFKGKEGEDVKGTCFTPGEDKPLGCKPSKKSDKHE